MYLLPMKSLCLAQWEPTKQQLVMTPAVLVETTSQTISWELPLLQVVRLNQVSNVRAHRK
jgi:hypothetical protein